MGHAMIGVDDECWHRRRIDNPHKRTIVVRLQVRSMPFLGDFIHNLQISGELPLSANGRFYVPVKI
jgi:hypothetical protein